MSDTQKFLTEHAISFSHVCNGRTMHLHTGFNPCWEVDQMKDAARMLKLSGFEDVRVLERAIIEI